MTNFCTNDPSLNHKDLPSRDQVDLQAISGTNLRKLSEVNELCPLRSKVENHRRPSILFDTLSGGVMDLSTTLTTTFMRVNLHSPRGHTPLQPSWTRSVGSSMGGEVEGPLTCPPSKGILFYSSAVTSNIQTYDPHLANKPSLMSQTFNQEYLLDLHHPS